MTKPKLEIVGEDLVVRNVRCTCFGGLHDPQDSGKTASGLSTKNPKVRGVALPRRYIGKNRAVLKALGDGLFPPRLPFHLQVEITELKTGKKTTAPFIDIGPATHTGNYLDVTVAVAREFDPKATATRFAMRCDFRVIGGARYATE